MFFSKLIAGSVESWKVVAGWIAIKKTDGNLYLREAQEDAESQLVNISGSIELYELTDKVLTIKTTDGNLFIVNLKAGE